MSFHEIRKDKFLIRIAESLADENFRKEWVRCNGSLSKLTPERLLVLELAQPTDLTFRYLLLYINDSNGNPGEAVAATYFQVLNFGRRNFHFSNPTILQRVISLLTWIRSFRILMMGNFFSVNFPAWTFKSGRIALEEFISILEWYVNTEKYDIWVLKDLPEPLPESQIHSAGIIKSDADLTMILTCDPGWNSFDDYLHSLKKKYRRRALKIRIAGSEMQRIQIDPVLFTKYRSRIGELFRQCADRQTVQMGIVDEKYFEEMQKVFPLDFEMTGYFIKDKLVAFATYISHPDMLETHYIGIDYSYNLSHAIYFNILFDGIEKVIPMRKRFLELGRTAREAKSMAGCQPVYFNDYLKIRSTLVRYLLGIMQNNFQSRMGENWKRRNPYKVSPASSIK